MDDEPIDAIHTRERPTLTERGREVLGFHLHRFLTDWLESHDVGVVHVTVGYEGSVCEPVTMEVTPQCCESVNVEWNFDDLCHAYRYGDGRLRIEHRGGVCGQVAYDVVPILDRPATGGELKVVSGYLLLCETEPVSREAVSKLQRQAAEALRTARRNGIRMFFETRDRQAIKSLIYDALDHLPEWFGCDRSASLLMTSTLDTMTLRDSSHGRFDVLAERLYLDSEETREASGERLVGMSVLLDDEAEDLLSRAVERQRRDPALPYQIYERTDEGDWQALHGDGSAPVPDFHRLERRPRTEMCLLVPLLIEERSDIELLGFLRLDYCRRRELSSSIGEELANFGRRLSSALYFSPLYTLSARKLWLLQRTRSIAQHFVEGDGPVDERRDRMIGEITSLITHHADVPSLAIGRIETRDDSDERVLRYRHPHGWTHFEDATLPVDVAPEDRFDSGVSALAARLDRPVILSGGHDEGDRQHFKNHLWVHERRQSIADARSRGGNEIGEDSGWNRLRDYYKPARLETYATLAYPIDFGDDVLGVLTVEVEEGTNWIWWTGFGGQLFWKRIADELADAFRHLEAS